jgi:exonuclease V gamma subunit
MSTLYLGTDLVSLAGRLAEVLDEAVRDDCFRTVTIVVPNRNVRKWLQLWLARRDGVAINLTFDYLENVLWELLGALDPRSFPAPLELLDDEQYRLLILAPLLTEERGPSALTPLRQYLGDRDRQSGRRWWRRAWQLAGQLAALIRDYEYHRHDAIVAKWLTGRDAFPDADAHDLALERAQRELFRRVTRVDSPEEGLRARLGGLLRPPKVCKTLPQYAGELRHEVKPDELRCPAAQRVIPLFGVTQLSAFHTDVLHWLGQRYDLRLFHPNPLLGSLRELPAEPAAAQASLQALAGQFRKADAGTRGDSAAPPLEDLRSAWCVGGAESLALAADLLKAPGSFRPELVPSAALWRGQENTPQQGLFWPDEETTPQQGAPRKGTTVLARLQDHLLGGPGTNAARLAQDTSLQVVACPGPYREVETVHASIVDNLRRQPDLKQTDVAVLVTDMPRYRPAIQAVFDRDPQPLRYNLADFSAVELNFGRAVGGLLDLALESFTRSRVFEVLLNPCFLARLGVDRPQASVWLHWAEELGVYHGWDGEDRQERGYANSALFGWQLALRRLRLGRIMTASDGIRDGPMPSYKDVVPHADFWSSDKEHLDAFCRAVEALLPRLRKLRTADRTGEAWAGEIRALVDDFLLVPGDLSAEAQVRDRLFGRLDDLRLLDGLRSAAGPLPLALVREFLADCLEKTVGTFGRPLTSGVTIATLDMLRALPFRMLYILGLGESLFPGADSRLALDLRHRRSLPGDIRPSETNRFLFLEALLAARDKAYLLYDCRELQRDQELHPSSVISQLLRFLKEHVLSSEKGFEIAKVPLRGSDPRYLGDPSDRGPWDVFVSYSAVDRLVALEEARKQGELGDLTANQRRDAQEMLSRYRRDFRKDFQRAATLTPEQAEEVRTVNLYELVRFLRCPAEAALRRHLRLADEVEVEAADDEPFHIAFPRDHQLLRQAQERFIVRAVTQGIDSALGHWQDDFTALHDEWRRRCLAPDGPFGDANRERFLADLKRRVETAGLADFLDKQRGRQFSGPIQIGPPLAPVGAKMRLPALALDTARGPVRLVGNYDWVWLDSGAVVLLAIHTGSASRVKQKALCRPLLTPLLFGLALRAGQALADGEEFRRRFADRDLQVYLAFNPGNKKKGIAGYCWSPEQLPPERARDYLAALAAEFLDPSGFDLLPADIVFQKKDFRRPFSEDVEVSEHDRRRYAKQLREAVAEDGENEQSPAYRGMRLLRIVGAQVPPDAFDKVRRRFRLLAPREAPHEQ